MDVPLAISLDEDTGNLRLEEFILDCIAEERRPTLEQIQELDQVR